MFPRPCLSSTLVVHRVQEFSLSTHYKSFSCLFMPHKGMSAAAPGLQLRQVSCYIHSDKTIRCVQLKKNSWLRNRKGLVPHAQDIPLFKTCHKCDLLHSRIAKIYDFFKKKSLTYMLWSLKANPAHRRPETTLRVAGEGEPFLQFAL